MEAKVNINDAAKSVTMEVEVTGVKAFVWRLKIARFLIWAAAFVLGCEIEVKGLR
jgi:hypothetical protein